MFEGYQNLPIFQKWIVSISVGSWLVMTLFVIWGIINA